MIVLTQRGAAHTMESPTQFYPRYRAAVQSATSMEQILEFWADDLAKSYTSIVDRHGYFEPRRPDC